MRVLSAVKIILKKLTFEHRLLHARCHWKAAVTASGRCHCQARVPTLVQCHSNVKRGTCPPNKRSGQPCTFTFDLKSTLSCVWKQDRLKQSALGQTVHIKTRGEVGQRKMFRLQGTPGGMCYSSGMCPAQAPDSPPAHHHWGERNNAKRVFWGHAQLAPLCLPP